MAKFGKKYRGILKALPKQAVSVAEAVKFIKAHMALGDAVGWPDDVAYAAIYLGSDEAKWVTGEILSVDGGWLC